MVEKTKKNPKGAGRKTIYNKNFHPKWAKSLAKRGLIDIEIAKELGISKQTLNVWKKKHPEFLNSLKKGKEIPDKKVEHSLYERACGYEHPEDKIFYDSKSGEVIVQPTIKHYPPSEVACIFWLKNRRPDRWRDKQDIEHKVDGAVIDIINGIFSKKDKKLNLDDE
jgi:hypothetical protein